MVTTCQNAMLRTERERFDQRFVARHGSIAPAPTKKYVKHQAFKKKLSNMCPQVRSTGIGHKTSSFSRPRCLRQGLHCTQEGPQSLHVQSMRTVGKMCLDLAIGVLRALFEKAPVRQGRFGAKFAKRQLFFDTQIFLFRNQKVIFGIHTAVRQGFNVGFCQSKCSVVFSFGVFSSTFQVGPIDHCQRPVKHTNCLPVTFTRAKLVRP